MDQALAPLYPGFAARLGRWWFQRRGVSPLPALILCLLAPATFVPSRGQWILLGLGIGLAELGRIWAVGFAGSATRTRGDTVPRLVVAGPFRHVRNPLYISNIALYTFAAFAFGLVFPALLVCVYFSLQYALIVRFEEEVLGREFGDAYGFYRARVRRWLPSLKPRIESTGDRFELFQALRSERATFLALLCLAVLIFLKHSLQ